MTAQMLMKKIVHQVTNCSLIEELVSSSCDLNFLENWEKEVKLSPYEDKNLKDGANR